MKNYDLKNRLTYDLSTSILTINLKMEVDQIPVFQMAILKSINALAERQNMSPDISYSTNINHLTEILKSTSCPEKVLKDIKNYS